MTTKPSSWARWADNIIPGLIIGMVTAAGTSYGTFKVMDHRLETLEVMVRTYTERAAQIPLNQLRLDRLERDVEELKRTKDQCPR